MQKQGCVHNLPKYQYSLQSKWTLLIDAVQFRYMSMKYQPNIKFIQKTSVDQHTFFKTFTYIHKTVNRRKLIQVLYLSETFKDLL